MEEEKLEEVEMIEKEPEIRTAKQGGFWKGLFVGILGTALAGGFFYCKEEGIFRQWLMPEEANQISLTDSDTQKKLRELQDVINYYYLEDVDSETVEEWMYRGVMAGLQDVYADYYTLEELNSLTDSTNGSYEGIGAVMSQNTTTGEISVVKCYEGTPAAEAGLLPGDIVLQLNEESISGMNLTDLVTEIKTGEADEISLTVQREGEEELQTVNMTRRVVEIPTVSYEMLENSIGYILINEFDSITVSQFKEAKADLEGQGMEKLIVDLRNNPGGNLSSIVDIMEQILPEGLIVYTEDRYGNRSEYTCDGEQELTIPLAVLINGQSASASEIFAGAVKDYGIGTLVGTTTFGKGIVQRVIELSDGTAVKLTMAKYYTPKGNDIHEKGVEPDVEVELEEGLEQLVTIPKEQDNQLLKAIEILEEQ